MRPRHRPRPRRIHLNIPEDVLAQLDLLLLDPSRGRPIYGGYSTLVTALLRRWLEEPTICPEFQLVEDLPDVE